MFDVAVGERAISHMGHIKMMGAVQPFISGAISKTVNLPQEATVEDIADAYTQAWRLGVKALAIYRDGSKTAQALRTDAQSRRSGAGRRRRRSSSRPSARRSPRPGRGASGCRASASRSRTSSRSAATRATSPPACTRTARVGEIFLTDIGKEGSTLRGMMNSFATAISIALQYGVPLETLVQKFSYMRFEPEGITGNPEIPFAKSMPDYIMRWLASRFLDADAQEELGILTPGGARPQGGAGGRPVACSASDTAGPGGTAADGQPATRRRPSAGNGGAERADGGADRHAAGRPGALCRASTSGRRAASAAA